MPNRITFVYPYYENPQMLRRQLRRWKSYPPQLLECIRIILVDDGSPDHPASAVIGDDCGLPIELYRIKENIPWNQHGARNLGAHVADDGWLLLTDMDIVVPRAALAKLVTRRLDPKCFYVMKRRRRRSAGTTFDSHANTFFLTRKTFWRVGGYDEDYCGSYGGDAQFGEALREVAKGYLAKDVVVQEFTSDKVPDANTRGWNRGVYHQEFLRRLKRKQRTGNTTSVRPLRFTWSQEFPQKHKGNTKADG